MTLDDVELRWPWRPIPHCPGRFVLTKGASTLSPAELLGGPVETTEHRSTAARDPVLITPLDDGGLISFRRADGTYVHTLNSSDGFARKLWQLGIASVVIRST